MDDEETLHVLFVLAGEEAVDFLEPPVVRAITGLEVRVAVHKDVPGSLKNDNI